MSPENSEAKMTGYKPVRVHNPTGACHSVFLEPGQRFEVLFSRDNKIYEDLSIVIKSPYIIHERADAFLEGKLFRFCQRYDLKEWSKVSTTFLGEILVRGSNNFESKICVFMRASNACKENIVTVVNPDNHTIKIQPYQIIEVVCYNSCYGLPLYWDCDEEFCDPRLEKLGHTFINPNIYDPMSAVRGPNDAFFVYPRINQDRKMEFYQYHFWFRCRGDIADIMKNLQPGFYPPAQLKFSGIVGIAEKVTSVLNVVFNQRERINETMDRAKQICYTDSDMSKDFDTDVSSKEKMIPVVASIVEIKLLINSPVAI